ncbi:MAG: prepilin-type N-terminal cleavage/methylation domain-containing protein [bacterium]
MTLRIGNKGFTLIEVLVAAVILFAGLGAVLKAYSLAVVAMESAADKLAIFQVMQEKTAELDFQVSGSDITQPAGEGRQKVGNYEYLWRIQSIRQVLTPQVSILRAVIEISRVNRPQGSSCVCEWAQFREKEQVR